MGNDRNFCNRDFDVLSLLKDYKLYCFEITKTSRPRHSLFLSLNTELKEYNQKSIIA
ncbi:hypothetical protein ACFHWD_09920 [Clostridium sp. MT-14]|jgi:hypothetical protein|uniref:DUF1643 domain-containing protein n=1 Tax=unclassified Clostridium TaxID=2614128 RepID=UPI001239BD7A|nr:DUF1643 domain-containing protein [Clostridium sp. HV4-5-A1G]KAA8675275.1 DUF1643 domain-containing protein [Clostridium sp. HV4-5-A1G]